jgi:hypothetical protein
MSPRALLARPRLVEQRGQVGPQFLAGLSVPRAAAWPMPPRRGCGLGRGPSASAAVPVRRRRGLAGYCLPAASTTASGPPAARSAPGCANEPSRCRRAWRRPGPGRSWRGRRRKVRCSGAAAPGRRRGSAAYRRRRRRSGRRRSAFGRAAGTARRTPDARRGRWDSSKPAGDPAGPGGADGVRLVGPLGAGSARGRGTIPAEPSPATPLK